jgi:hypothetical protein
MLKCAKSVLMASVALLSASAIAEESVSLKEAYSQCESALLNEISEQLDEDKSDGRLTFNMKMNSEGEWAAAEVTATYVQSDKIFYQGRHLWYSAYPSVRCEVEGNFEKGYHGRKITITNLT